MVPRQLALIGGISYVVIFFTAIYANFFVLEALMAAPLETVTNQALAIRMGILAFMVAAVFDVVVAWVLFALYPTHPLTLPSTYFRLMHATIMGAAVFALVPVVEYTSAAEIITAVTTFNTLWLIGLFFFGVHLMFLSRIVAFIRIIPYFLFVAGLMYMLDTSAHVLLAEYDVYASIFLVLVAIPSVVGEMAFGLWLLFKGGATTHSRS